MIVNNKDGRQIEIVFMGDYEAPEVDEAYYIDSEDDVSDDDIEYIMRVYGAEIQELLELQGSFDFEEAV